MADQLPSASSPETLWNRLPGLTWAVTPARVLVAVSDDLLDLLKVNRSAVLHQDIATLFCHHNHTLPPGGLATLIQQLKDIARTGQERTLHSVSDQPGHRPRAFELRYRPVLGDDASVAYIVHQAVEIAAPPPAPSAAVEPKFQALVEASAQMIWITNAAGELVEETPSWQSFTGQTYAEYRGMGWVNALHPEQRERVVTSWKQRLQEESTARTLVRIRHASGGWRWLAMRAAPFRNAAGQVEGWIGMSLDFTEQKQAADALRESETRYRALVAHLPGGAAFEVDHDLRYRVADGQALREAGLSPADLEGKTLEEAFGPEFAATYAPFYQQALSGKPFEWEHQAYDRTYVSRGVPLCDEAGKIYAALAVSYDITERKQGEEALLQAKESAEQASRAKEDFLSHMSHEIRTPLNAVVGLTNLLLTQNLNSAHAEHLQTLKFSADNLRSLVDDILDFSKIQAGKVVLDETPVRLSDLVNSLRKAHQPHAQQQDTRLEFHLDPALPEEVLTDQLKLSQVLHNLLSNALKFTQKGVVTLEVSLPPETPTNDRFLISFSVRDTGIGIPPDKLATVFEVFTQADSSTARQYGGTGLGLSITRDLLALMGSRIEVESQPGAGSRFFFTLPVSEMTPQKRAPADPVPKVDFSDLAVLMVEDMAVNRMVFQQFLQHWWQVRPDEAANGQEAVAMAERKQYDLILMDVRMPVMDGYQATQAIRALPNRRYQQTPIIALTADTVNELQKHADPSLFTDVITKPFVPEKAQQTIVRHLLLAQPALAEKPTGTADLLLNDVASLFGGAPAEMSLFMNDALAELRTLQTNLDQALVNQDERVLAKATHQTQQLIGVLGLITLKEHLSRCGPLLAGSPTAEQLTEARWHGKTVLNQAIAAIENALARDSS